MFCDNVGFGPSLAPTGSEQEFALTQLIQSLDVKEEYRTSSVRLHAQTLRAQLRLDMHQYDAALHDTNELIELLGGAANTANAALHRIAADAYEQLHQCADAAMEWRKVAQCDPKFQTKAVQQVQRLQKLMKE